ncbi:glyoxalase [Methanomassiliicoccales archaeon RumEn M1]|jgi:predicted lactoylglutathione lyase|nr:glyoxalase [Methanomassiliicoccales archaeon RumEn M1]
MTSRIVSVLTLGVTDLARSSAFYERLGFRRSNKSDEEIVWFATGGTVLALYPWNALAEDATVPSEGQGFRGTTMAINLSSEREVDEFLERVKSIGGTVVKQPQKVFWGGYSSYFQDPDGHLWEVAFNPFTPVDASGKLDIRE